MKNNDYHIATSKEFKKAVDEYEKFLKRMERDLDYKNHEDRKSAEIGYLIGELKACYLEIEDLKSHIELLLKEKKCLENLIKELK